MQRLINFFKYYGIIHPNVDMVEFVIFVINLALLIVCAVILIIKGVSL